MLKIRIVLIICILPFYTVAQSSRSLGMGRAMSTEREVHAIFHNPAGTAFNSEHFALADYINAYFIRELDLKNLGVHYSLPSKSLSANISRKGDERLQMTGYRVSYGQLFGDWLSLGVSLNVKDRSFGDIYGRKLQFFSELGSICILEDKHILSFWLVNPEGAGAGMHELDKLESKVVTGYECLLSDRFKIILEAEKEVSSTLNLKLAWVYSPLEKLRFHSGIETGVRRFGLGLVTDIRSISLDLNFAYHMELGLQSGISISTSLEKTP